MKKISELISKYNNTEIKFVDVPYCSSDQRTILGETTFGELLFLPYRDTNIGSNPREYIGLKKTNISIFNSLINNYNYLFRFLHSGVIVCITTPQKIDNNVIKFEDCCLTNGNQTRYVILSLALIKLLKGDELKEISKKEMEENLKDITDKPETIDIINKIKNKINTTISYLKKDEDLYLKYKKITLDDLLTSKIRIQINVVSSIVDENYVSNDEYIIGTSIAEANNDTQKVREDDIFSNRHQSVLRTKIFNNFSNSFPSVTVEYKFGEVEKNKEKVHILTLLRPIVATGIICQDKDIFNLTNQRQPIYALFAKVLKASKSKPKTISIISKMIPLLYEIRKKYIIPILEQKHDIVYREYLEKANAGDLDNTSIGKNIKNAKGKKDEIEKVIKGLTNYNIEHIVPVVIYTIRKTFYENNDKIDLGIPYENRQKAFSSIIEAIYKRYVKMKVDGLPTSLTTVVREQNFYEFGIDAYGTTKQFCLIEESDFVKDNKNIVKLKKKNK